MVWTSYIWMLTLVCQQVAEYEDADMYKSQMINALQYIIEIITQDVMIRGHE